MTSRLSSAGVFHSYSNAEAGIQRTLFVGDYSEGRGKKTSGKETMSNYLVVACESIYCNEFLSLCKISSSVLKQKSNHI